MSVTVTTGAARERVLRAVLRVLTAERAEPHAHADAEAEYAAEELMRDLAAAIELADVKPGSVAHRAYDLIVEVRDSCPREPCDVDSWEIVGALAAAGLLRGDSR